MIAWFLLTSINNAGEIRYIKQILIIALIISLVITTELHFFRAGFMVCGKAVRNFIART